LNKKPALLTPKQQKLKSIRKTGESAYFRLVFHGSIAKAAQSSKINKKDLLIGREHEIPRFIQFIL
jgi:hypothetical protein